MAGGGGGVSQIGYLELSSPLLTVSIHGCVCARDTPFKRTSLFPLFTCLVCTLPWAPVEIVTHRVHRCRALFSSRLKAAGVITVGFSWFKTMCSSLFSADWSKPERLPVFACCLDRGHRRLLERYGLSGLENSVQRTTIGATHHQASKYVYSKFYLTCRVDRYWRNCKSVVELV